MRDLLSYRLARLSNTISRSAALRLRRQFGIGLGEWRTIGLIGEGGLSPNEIARQSNLDKGQVSRIVSALVERGLIQRDGEQARGRTTRLSLSEEGLIFYRSLMGVARERDATLFAALTDQESRILREALQKLQDVSLLMMRAENTLAKEDQPSKTAD